MWVGCGCEGQGGAYAGSAGLSIYRVPRPKLLLLAHQLLQLLRKDLEKLPLQLLDDAQLLSGGVVKRILVVGMVLLLLLLLKQQ